MKTKKQLLKEFRDEFGVFIDGKLQEGFRVNPKTEWEQLESFLERVWDEGYKSACQDCYELVGCEECKAEAKGKR